MSRRSGPLLRPPLLLCSFSLLSLLLLLVRPGSAVVCLAWLSLPRGFCDDRNRPTARRPARSMIKGSHPCSTVVGDHEAGYCQCAGHREVFVGCDHTPFTCDAACAGSCAGWRNTGGCDPNGPREPAKDVPCSALVGPHLSGYCECMGGWKAGKASCGHKAFYCYEACRIAFENMDGSEQEQQQQQQQQQERPEPEVEVEAKMEQTVKAANTRDQPPPRAQQHQPSNECLGTFRTTGGCSPDGPREPLNDIIACAAEVPAGTSGFCECEGGRVPDAGRVACGHAPLECASICRRTKPTALASTAPADSPAVEVELDAAGNVVHDRGGGDSSSSSSSALVTTSSYSESRSKPSRKPTRSRCVMWRNTANCDPYGLRQSHLDLPCDALILPGKSGYCECAEEEQEQEQEQEEGHHWARRQVLRRFSTNHVRCKHLPFTCHESCRRGCVGGFILDPSVACTPRAGTTESSTARPVLPQTVPCGRPAPNHTAGYCDCVGGLRVQESKSCDRGALFTCDEACFEALRPVSTCPARTRGARSPIPLSSRARGRSPRRPGSGRGTINTAGAGGNEHWTSAPGSDHNQCGRAITVYNDVATGDGLVLMHVDSHGEERGVAKTGIPAGGDAKIDNVCRGDWWRVRMSSTGRLLKEIHVGDEEHASFHVTDCRGGPSSLDPFTSLTLSSRFRGGGFWLDIERGRHRAGSGGGGGGGGQGPGWRRHRGNDIQLHVSQDMQDVYREATVVLHWTRQVVCPLCGGRGGPAEHEHRCGDCGGTGRRHHHHHWNQHSYNSRRHPGDERDAAPPSYHQEYSTPCTTCDGRGSIIAAAYACPRCHGRRTVPERRFETVKLPRGFPENYQAVFRGLGDHLAEPGGAEAAGDVVVTCGSKPHDIFRRHGADLETTVNITLLEALVGFNRTLPHVVRGRELRLQRLGMTPPGFVETIVGEGLPFFYDANADKEEAEEEEEEDEEEAGREWSQVDDDYDARRREARGSAANSEPPRLFGDVRVSFRVEFPRTVRAQQKERLRSVMAAAGVEL